MSWSTRRRSSSVRLGGRTRSTSLLRARSASRRDEEAVMLALSKAQGLIIAVGGAVVLLAAGGALVSRGRVRRTEEPPRIPFAMRPGPSDPDLETPLLTKLQGWGVLLVAFFVIWIPLTWLFEPHTNLDQE